MQKTISGEQLAQSCHTELINKTGFKPGSPSFQANCFRILGLRASYVQDKKHTHTLAGDR